MPIIGSPWAKSLKHRPLNAALAARHRFGTKVSFTLTLAASVHFTVLRASVGRRAKGGGCVVTTKSNRHARHCTRLVPVRGGFTVTGRAGSNSFRFTGRIGGRKLPPGSYRLVATPLFRGRPGRASSAAFRIIK